MNKSRLSTINKITVFFILLTIIDSISIIPFDVKDVYILAFGGILTMGYTAYFSAKSYENKKDK